MDLKLIKQYFQVCLEEQNRLFKSRKAVLSSNITAYSLYELIALKKEPSISKDMLFKFLEGFNWHGRVSAVDSNGVNVDQNFKLYKMDGSRKKTPEQKEQESDQNNLQNGIELLIKSWGKKSEQSLNFDQFCILVKGVHEMPNPLREKAQFKNKQMLFELLINEIAGVVRLQSFKKAIYHKFKNMTDLFEMLTAEETFNSKHLQRLFLSFGERLESESLDKISRRAEMPWNFEKFIDSFKKVASASNNTNEYKVFYSSIRKSKKGDQTPDRNLTTPRRGKTRVYPSSTKLTKREMQEISEESRVITQFTLGDQQKQAPETSVDLLSDILTLQEQFYSQKRDLISRTDFDLQLVYERHGKRFEKILNEKLGVCNFSAFCRFILPKTYQHKYLSFIRYQSDNQLSQETQEHIDHLLSLYNKKQSQIRQLWRNFDAEAVYRSLCLPAEDKINSFRLKQYFSSRETEILLERFDPHKKGYIEFAGFH